MSSGEDSYDAMEDSWIEWFCNLKGHEFFCEVDRAYIEDGFNLYGLRNEVNNFMDCLHLILDETPPDDTEETSELLLNASRLYGLIHARFILTSAGLEAMYSKFLAKEFGTCPRFLCKGQPVVPVGPSDDVGVDTVKVFCPLCGDIYRVMSHPADGSRLPDGAFFGRTFAHLFFMTFEDLVPDPSRTVYVPRIFGFKVHSSSKSLCVAKRTRGHLGIGVGSSCDPNAVKAEKPKDEKAPNRSAEKSGAGDVPGALSARPRGMPEAWKMNGIGHAGFQRVDDSARGSMAIAPTHGVASLDASAIAGSDAPFKTIGVEAVGRKASAGQRGSEKGAGAAGSAGTPARDDNAPLFALRDGEGFSGVSSSHAAAATAIAGMSVGKDSSGGSQGAKKKRKRGPPGQRRR